MALPPWMAFGEGVAEREGDRLAFAQVGQPVPGEAFAVGLDTVEKGRRRRGEILFEAGRAAGIEEA